jgi:hypothetical protein
MDFQLILPHLCQLAVKSIYLDLQIVYLVEQHFQVAVPYFIGRLRLANRP